MSYVKKTWTDRQSEFPTRRKLVSTGNENEYDVARSEGAVSQEGDPLNAENLNDLENRISNGIEGNSQKKLSGFSIPASEAWEQVSAQSWDTEGTFLYRYAVAIEGVTTDDQLRPVFDSKTLLSGVIAPVGETYEGGAYFYASEIPDWQVKCVELTKVRVY